MASDATVVGSQRGGGFGVKDLLSEQLNDLNNSDSNDYCLLDRRS